MTRLGHFTFIGLAAAVCAGGCSGPGSAHSDATDAALVRPALRGTKYGVEMAQADVNHQLGLQKCQVLSGVQGKACRAQVDADYEMLKSIAKTQYPELASAR
jgi:hypothetical protein